MSERCPARLPALAGHGEALWGGPGPLRLGDPVCHSYSLHLHRRNCLCMGTGEEEAVSVHFSYLLILADV